MPIANAMPAFDTFRSADQLQAAGMPEAQAKATVQVISYALETGTRHLATQDDLKLVSAELRGEMRTLSAELRGEMRLIRWIAGPSLLGMMIGMGALLVKNFAG